MTVKKEASESIKVTAVLYKNKTLADGKHPVMIRITKQRKSSYKSTGFSSTIAQWSKKDHQANDQHPQMDALNEKIRDTIGSLYDQAREQNKKGKTTSPKKLKKLLRTEKMEQWGFLAFTQKLIDGFNEEERYGNANVYKYCLNKVGKFLNPKAKQDPDTKKFIFAIDIEFPMIDYDWLRKLEIHLGRNGLKENSLSQVFRTIRAIYNIATKSSYQLATPADYPFGEFSLGKRFEVDPDPDFIPLEDVWKIEKLSINSESPLFDARNYFLFSFYGGGLNLKDVASLKWSNKDGDIIKLKRSKTNRKGKIYVTEPLRRILDYYQLFTGSNPSNYIFPIFNRAIHITEKQRHDRFKNHRSDVINPSLKTIATMAGLSREITSKVARYSFATALWQAGIDTKTIAEAMARKNDKGLESYLGKADEKIKRAINNNLVSKS
jgi:integrase/recombinase XerD